VEELPDDDEDEEDAPSGLLLLVDGDEINVQGLFSAVDLVDAVDGGEEEADEGEVDENAVPEESRRVGWFMVARLPIESESQ